jgi:DNA-directed RNA polymerase specialized sigma24 family protein
LKLTEKAVESRLSRARYRLREKLLERLKNEEAR